MRDALLPGLLIFLQISIFVNIRFIASYIKTRNKVSLKGFQITTFINFVIGMLMLAVVMRNPAAFADFKFHIMMVLESGLFFFMLLFIKLRITVRVIRRMQNPDYYDISFFGRKVLKLEVVKKSELAIYILTMPFTLIFGAYFIVNIFI